MSKSASVSFAKIVALSTPLVISSAPFNSPVSSIAIGASLTAVIVPLTVPVSVTVPSLTV